MSASIAAFARSEARPDAGTMTPADILATLRLVAGQSGSTQADAAATITAIALARPAARLHVIAAEAILRLRAGAER